MRYDLSVNSRHSRIVTLVAAQIRLDAAETSVAVGRILVLIVAGSDLHIVGDILPRATAHHLTLHDRRAGRQPWRCRCSWGSCPK